MRPEDWSGLAPERDRPAPSEFDWTPEALNLTAAAAYIVSRREMLGRGVWADQVRDDAIYTGVITLWSEMCAMDEAAALIYAYSIADAVPPVMGTAVPF